MKPNSSNPPSAPGIVVTEVPEEKKYYLKAASSPALDPARSPLASERIQILDLLQKDVRNKLGKLASAEQAIVELLQATRAYDMFICEQAAELFTPPVVVATLLSEGEIKKRMLAESLLVFAKVKRGATSLVEICKSDPDARSLVTDLTRTNSGSAEFAPFEQLFKQVVAAQRRKEDLVRVVLHTVRISENKLSTAAKSCGDPEVSALLKRFSTTLADVTEQVSESKPLKLARREGVTSIFWGEGMLNVERIISFVDQAYAVADMLRAKVRETLPQLRDSRERIGRAVAKNLPRERLQPSAGLSAEDVAILRYAWSHVPSERDASAGDAPQGFAVRADQRFREIESKIGLERVRSRVDALEVGSEGRSGWLTSKQADFLRGVLDGIQEERTAQERVASLRDAFKEETQEDVATHEEPVVEEVVPALSTKEYLREIFGLEVLGSVQEKLTELPSVEQVEARTVALEDVAAFAFGSRSAGRGFALVSKMLASNPHLLTMPNFEEYCDGLTRALTRIEKLGLTKPIYDIMVSTHRFSGPSALAETVACIDRASTFKGVVSALNDAGLKGEAVMALLRYGFFFQGRLQFGPCVGADRMIFENVDKQSEQSFLRKDLEKALTALNQAGVIGRPSRSQGAFLSRDIISGARHADQIGKALQWVIANPDPRVEF